MENDDTKIYRDDLTNKIHDDINDRMRNRRNFQQGRKGLIGLFLIAGGVLLLANKMGAVFLPDWFFTWPVLVIGVGFLIGLQHNFRSFAWLIVIAWGTYALLDQQMPAMHLKNYNTPLVLIFVGSFFLLRRRHPKTKDMQNMQWKIKNDYYNTYSQPVQDDSEFIDSTCIFSGTKKVILSKNFKGGDITCFMGGVEIDLSQADIQSTAVLDATTIFGSIKLRVPSNWNIKMQNTTILGGIEDKRHILNLDADKSKQLIIDGTTVFGGIELSN